MSAAWGDEWPQQVFPAGVTPGAKRCTACSNTGIYIGYGGPEVGPIAVACKTCKGLGWIVPEPPPDIEGT